MVRTSSVFALSGILFAGMFSACTESNNGSVRRDGGATGGAGGAAGGSGGPSLDVGGSDGYGGADGGAGADGALDGGAGADGALDGGAVDVPSYCMGCVNEAAAKAYVCPVQRPTTQEALRTVCHGFLGRNVWTLTVTSGPCGVGALPSINCNGIIADPNVDVLSFNFFPGAFHCQYSRTTGALVGQVVRTDSSGFCGGSSAAQTSGVTNPWCAAIPNLSVSCTVVDGGTDAAPDVPADAPSDGPSVDGGVASACPACGPDELCVGYYDGTCKAMSTRCRKVSAETRNRILVRHERCFGTPLGDEICGTADSGVFMGCGGPPCPNETLVSDINCYGP